MKRGLNKFSIQLHWTIAMCIDASSICTSLYFILVYSSYVSSIVWQFLKARQNDCDREMHVSYYKKSGFGRES